MTAPAKAVSGGRNQRQQQQKQQQRLAQKNSQQPFETFGRVGEGFNALLDNFTRCAGGGDALAAAAWRRQALEDVAAAAARCVELADRQARVGRVLGRGDVEEGANVSAGGWSD